MRRVVDDLYRRHNRRGQREARVNFPFGGLIEAERGIIESALLGGDGAPVIVADNVAEYLFCDVDKERWSFADDFPSLAPPFPAFWIDWRRPSRPLRSEDKRIDPATWTGYYPREIAVYATSSRLDDGGWSIGTTVFGRPAEKGHGSPISTDGCPYLFEINEDGSFRKMTPVPFQAVQETFDHDGEKILDYCHTCAAGLYPWALTLSFLACKNVERERVTHHPKSQRAAVRKHGRPLVDYDVLRIDPLAKAGNGGGHGGGGADKRLHIVRGHFATYTAAAPLFGRFVGTVWKESHTRGHGPGRHEKRYQVNAPQGGSQ